MATPTNIRDLRESKSLSQKAVRTAAGLKYSEYVRIESGSGKTTKEEVDRVMAVLKGMPDGTRKLAGRPFKDAEKQARVAAAREAGTSVAAVIYDPSAKPAKAAKAPAAKKAAAAPAAKAPAKKAPAAKKDLASALGGKPRSPKA